VANVDDGNNCNRATDTVNILSSRGYTNDNRVKPDIAAPGTKILSANNEWESESDFIEKSGTSMAAPHVAGAIEAAASTGGQLMPPIMGAGAFLMAEFTNTSYLTIIKVALVPAIMYYLTVLLFVHFYTSIQTIFLFLWEVR
jgi:subtilisin family serine protease